MKVSEKILSEMMSELAAMIVDQEECGQAKMYDNVDYVLLTNPIKMRVYEEIKTFNVIGLVDQEDTDIMVGNLDENGLPDFEEAESYHNGILTIYAQLCGVKIN